MSQIHVTPIDAARDAYTWAGLPVATTYAFPWRHPTPAEHAASPVAVQQSGWMLDERSQQLRLDVVRGGLVVLRVPCDHSADGPVWRGLQPYLAGAPAIESHDRRSTTYIFRQRSGAPVPEYRYLELITADGPGFERVAAITERDPHGGVRLPHAGMYERLIQGVPTTGIPELPESLAPLTMSSCVASPELIAEWLDRHFDKIGTFSRAKPTTRAEVWHAFLAANNLLESQISEKAFGDACHGAKCFDSKRTKHGLEWLITRKSDVTFGPMRGVESFMLSAVELAEFQQWRHSVELSPERVRARKAAAEAKVARDRDEAYIREHFGSYEVRDALRDSGYFEAHHECEGRRRKAGDPFGRSFRALDLAAARPDWWLDAEGKFDADMKPQARYESLVRRIVMAAEVA
jgi:hypothetical protein